MTLFQTITRTIFENPDVGSTAKDNPRTVTLVYPDNTRVQTIPMPRAVSEFDQLGGVITQQYTKAIAVQLCDVPIRPPRDTVVQGYAETWVVNSAELSDTETTWLLDLSLG